MLHDRLGLIRLLKNDPQRAAADFSEAIRLSPKMVDARNHLGVAFTQQGRPGDAIAEYREVLKLEPANLDALNNLAWILATARDGALRDAAEATALAEQACRLSDHSNPLFLDSLAAAYALDGRYQEAVAVVARAVAILRSRGELTQIPELEKRQDLYRRGLPYHE